MSIEIDGDAHHEHLERQRAVVMNRLARVIDVLDRKRHAVTDVVSGVVSEASNPEPSGDRHRTAIIVGGALLGGTLFAVFSAIARRRRERHNPLLQLGNALAQLSKPREPSLMKRLASEAAGSLLSYAASELGRVALQRIADQRVADQSARVTREPLATAETLSTPPIRDFT